MNETMRIPHTVDLAAPVNYLRAVIRGKVNRMINVVCRNVADRLWDAYLEPNYEMALGITLATHDYSYKPPYTIDWTDDEDDTPPFGDDDQLVDYGQMRPIDFEAARIAHEFDELDDEDIEDIDYDELFHSDSWEQP